MQGLQIRLYDLILKWMSFGVWGGEAVEECSSCNA